MTHSRHTELKQMLEARRRGLEAQVQEKIRGFREADTGVQRAPTELSDDGTQDDLDFALVEMKAQLAGAIAAALARLEAGDYGICHECHDEIPEQRLRAVPFATRCRTCQEAAEHVEGRTRRALERDRAFGPRVQATAGVS
jgi:DnaK suppressor protein